MSDEEVDLIKEWEEEVSQLYDFALNNQGQKQCGLLSISTEMAARFLAEAGIDVENFCHTLDADTIRHIHAGHGGNSEASHKRINKNDILNLRLVMTDPDTIIVSPKQHRGLIAIKISKTILGQKLCCVTTVRSGKKRLSPVTYYKDLFLNQRKNKKHQKFSVIIYYMGVYFFVYYAIIYT